GAAGHTLVAAAVHVHADVDAHAAGITNRGLAGFFADPSVGVAARVAQGNAGVAHLQRAAAAAVDPIVRAALQALAGCLAQVDGAVAVVGHLAGAASDTLVHAAVHAVAGSLADVDRGVAVITHIARAAVEAVVR